MNSLASIWADGRRNVATLVLWGLAAAFVVYVFITGGYLIAVLHFAFIYVVFVTGLNLFMGFTGQVSFGHNAFAAISGYASAVLTQVSRIGGRVLAAAAADVRAMAERASDAGTL